VISVAYDNFKAGISGIVEKGDFFVFRIEYTEDYIQKFVNVYVNSNDIINWKRNLILDKLLIKLNI